MRTNAKILAEQWRGVDAAQARHGVPDKIVAKMLGCGATTVRTNRAKGGWTIRALPDGFMTAEMLRQTGAIDPEDFDLFGAAEVQPALDEASLRRAHERLLAMIVNETAKVGLSELDPLAVKRLEAMANMTRSFEKILDMKARMVSPTEGETGGIEETAAVLEQIDRRVDELADRRARYIVEQCCRTGDCRAELPNAD